MTLFYFTLLVTTFAMMAIFAMMFFAVRLRRLLKAQLYHRAFGFFAVIAIAGMLVASIIGARQSNTDTSAFAISMASGK